MGVIEAFLYGFLAMLGEQRETHFVGAGIGGLVIDIVGVIESFLNPLAGAEDTVRVESYLGSVHSIVGTITNVELGV